MKVLVFQHVAVEHPGIFRDFLSQDGIARDTVELDEGGAIPALEDYAALIVMGGPMDVWQEREHPWLAAEKQAIRRAIVDLRLPFLGFCLGHQLMADALGGRVGKMSGPEVGVLDVELTPAGRVSALLAGLPATIKSLQWHGGEVIEAPPDSQILARSPLCGIQALQYGESAFGLQFHIEMIDSTVTDWGDIPAYKQALEQTLGPGALQSLKAETDKRLDDFNRSARVIYDNFIAIVKKRAA